MFCGASNITAHSNLWAVGDGLVPLCLAYRYNFLINFAVFSLLSCLCQARYYPHWFQNCLSKTPIGACLSFLPSDISPSLHRKSIFFCIFKKYSVIHPLNISPILLKSAYFSEHTLPSFGWSVSSTGHFFALLVSLENSFSYLEVHLSSDVTSSVISSYNPHGKSCLSLHVLPLHPVFTYSWDAWWWFVRLQTSLLD